ncbi:MAG: peptidyl-prolyl cis-trans isomerase, EpsD family [Pseudomonadota bacterium]|uniref:EpsD family peptidyl-prolyl cis-trans isomerase n=1 Tax=Sphaerotilus montanus TaxID=522889 RepID=A0A7Y9QTX5_9BURK|nr:EpsD family peptidyl-prolyl cis-trans isomerase [Sphaerotilus montanus]MBP8272224.1 EpsD family peptidyl-prolyl cis-trans isomerase [Sphaerotilus sp.]NYG31338.1 EpsD family peptidyl-prolyl cis-trans isomerase [Sphaerotilus montanus]NZD55319.1 peptidyl-prolyl cis-trans isomerase, EpsD family [Sphaerotilus montanus]
MTLSLFCSTARLRTSLVLGVIASASLLAACGGGSGDSDKKGSTQVAAKVNSGEISVHQVNFVLQRQQGLKPEQAQAVSRRVLDGLVDQELAVQQAIEQKLDRDPRIVSTIDAARRDILARAYADRVADAAVAPTAEDIKAYYDSKPALFSKRRIYGLQEFNIEANADQKAALKTKIPSLRSAEELAGALKAANIRFVARSVSQAPENIPMGFLDELAKTSEGQWVTVVTPAGMNVALVASAKPAPVTEEAAKKAIEQFLLSERKRKLVADGIKQLRGSAKIEYVGQFAAAASAAGDTAGTTAEAPAVAPTPPAGASDALDATALQKGLSGLK